MLQRTSSQTSNNSRLAGALQLAAVERHLRHDEESSVEDSGSGGRSNASRTTSSRRCETPPSSKRRVSLLRRRSGSREIPERFAAKLTNNNNNDGDSPLGGSRRGMSVTIETKQKQKDDDDEDSLSLSDDSSFDDSSDELEKRAHAIRHDLRMAELSEIARVAERAAESGVDTFTALASTYNNDDDTHDDLKPLSMKRNKTYSEGQRPGQKRGLFRRRLLRRQSSDGVRHGGVPPVAPLRRKRKIPVLALRHIDDLIPPCQQLHLHLRSHLYRVGVETEKSLVDEEVDLDAEVKPDDDEEAVGGEQRRSLRHQESLIRMMKSWVSVENTTSMEAVSEVSKFHVGDFLCEQITSPEVTSGEWNPGPVELPEGLVPPDEQDVVDEFSTPNRSKQRPPPSPSREYYHQGDQSTIETGQLTEPTSSSSEFGGGGDTKSNHLPKCPRTPLSAPEITPVALFDAQEDDKETPTLGSKEHPRPFEVVHYNEEYIEEYETPKRFRPVTAPPVSPNQMPNLYITPVRLKGIRDRKSGPKRSLTWGLPSGDDSFRSELGTAATFGCRPTSFPDDEESYDVKMAKSESDLFLLGDAPSWLVPRSRSVSEMISSIQQPQESTTQAPGQSTHDQSDTSTRKDVMKSLMHDSDDSSSSSLERHDIPGPPLTNSGLLRWQNGGGTPPPASSESPKTTPTPEKTVGSLEVTKTPSLDLCECLAKAAASSDSLSDDKNNETTELVPLSPALRRVMSCPSFADNWDDVEFGVVSSHAAALGVARTAHRKTNSRSLLSALHNFSPKSGKIDVGRTLDFGAEENSQYLNNYLYFGKPTERRENRRQLHEHVGPFCSDRPCGPTTEHSCELLAAVSDVASFLLEPQVRSKEKQLLSFKTNEPSGFTGETWFDTASEKFDSALERLVGPTRHSNKDWGGYFHAPTLNIKTPQSARKTRSDADDRKEMLVRQNVPLLQTDSEDSAPSDEEFSTLYGVRRNEFRAMSKEQREALWTERREHDQSTATTPSYTVPLKTTAHHSPLRKSKARSKHHRSVMSTSDIVTFLGTDHHMKLGSVVEKQ